MYGVGVKISFKCESIKNPSACYKTDGNSKSTIKREVEALHEAWYVYFLRMLMLHRTTNANKIEMVFFFFDFNIMLVKMKLSTTQ